jgi:RNA polymerase sigma factor (sigma-70 family)
MIERRSGLRTEIHSVAERAIQLYAQGILSEEWLVEQVALEWETQRVGNDEPTQTVLQRIAQRTCSRELCKACCSSEPIVRNSAFENVSGYLKSCLLHTPYARDLRTHEHALDDVLNKTLETLHVALNGDTSVGPTDAAAFLKWSQTILIRQAHTSVEKLKQEKRFVSLEAQVEKFGEQEHYIDRQQCPEEFVVHQELHQALTDAILSLRNPHHREVLLYTYLGGMDESELARKLDVPVQQVYMWRHRALKALSKQPEVMQLFRIWHE